MAENKRIPRETFRDGSPGTGSARNLGSGEHIRRVPRSPVVGIEHSSVAESVGEGR